jgi:GT2 family glycosyltransferase
MRTPSISVFIVNYNTCTLLQKCLRSIFDTKGNLHVEVFVADNNSFDGSTEMVKVRFPQVSLTRHSQNMGYTRAINPLLPLGRGKYYLLLHPDLEILPNTLKQFVEFFELHPQAGILGANLYYPDGHSNPCEVLWPGFRNDLLSFAVRLFRKLPSGGHYVHNFNPIEWSHKSTSKVASVWNACMMVRREVFETIGYFDEQFFYGSADWDLCKRTADAGWSVYYLRPAAAIHYERQSFTEDDKISEEIRYKVNGWYSAVWQYHDRNTFLRKHSGPAAIYGVKAIYITENILRLPLVLANLLFRRVTFKEASFQLEASLQAIRVILKG